MRKFVMLLGAGLWVAVAAGQTATTGTTTTPTPDDLLENTPTQNLRTSRDRAPGTWIQQSLTQHNELIGQRVNAPRTGDGGGVAPTPTTPTPGTGTATDGLGDLSGLLSLFGLGGLDVGGILGGGAGAIPGLTGTTGTTGATNNGQVDLSGFTPANGTDFTLDDLIRLRDMVEGTGTTNPLNTQTRSGGAIGRLPTAQSTTPTTPTTAERPFRLRLADRLVSTSFLTLNAALRTRPVVDAIKDALRPLFSGATDNGGGNNGGGNNNGGTGDGIDDIPSPGNGGGSGSVYRWTPGATVFLA